jgi:hypothetical protein
MKETLLFFLVSEQHKNLVVGTSLLVIGLVVAIALFILDLWLKNQKRKSTFKSTNQESRTIWAFTKKNFLIFVVLFFLIMAITGLMMLIKL